MPLDEKQYSLGRNNWACSLRVTTEGSINNSGMLFDTKCLLIYFPVHSFVFLYILNISLLSFVSTEENIEEEVEARVPCGKKTLSLGCSFSLDHNTEPAAPQTPWKACCHLQGATCGSPSSWPPPKSQVLSWGAFMVPSLPLGRLVKTAKTWALKSRQWSIERNERGRFASSVLPSHPVTAFWPKKEALQSPFIFFTHCISHVLKD